MGAKPFLGPLKPQRLKLPSHPGVFFTESPRLSNQDVVTINLWPG